MISNVSCAGSTGERAHRSAVAAAATENTNQRVAGAPSRVVDRLATGGSEQRQQREPTNWLQCGSSNERAHNSSDCSHQQRAQEGSSANQFSKCKSRDLWAGGGAASGQSDEHQLNLRLRSGEKAAETNNSSQRGDAVGATLAPREAPLGVDCSLGLQAAERGRRRSADRADCAQRVPAHAALRSGCIAAPAAASADLQSGAQSADIQIDAGESAHAYSSSSSSSNDNNSNQRATKRAAPATSSSENLIAASGLLLPPPPPLGEDCEHEATFWAKLSNLSRSIIHQRQHQQRQQAAVAAAAASGERATFGHSRAAEEAAALIAQGAPLAPEVVGYLESKRRRAAVRRRRRERQQCAGDLQVRPPSTTQAQAAATVPEVAHVNEDNTRVQLLCSAQSRVENECSSTACDEKSNQKMDPVTVVAATTGSSMTYYLFRYNRRKRERKLKLERERAAAEAGGQLMAPDDAAAADDGEAHQVCEARPDRKSRVSKRSGARATKQRVIKPVELQQTIKGKMQQQQQQQQQQMNTNTTNTATSSTTRSSSGAGGSASSLSSCILTETSTARSDAGAQQACGAALAECSKTQGANAVAEEGQQERSEEGEEGAHVRLKWDKKMDFLLSIIGFAVDLANIWRFPYLVYKNGGGVFLIPYLTMLIFGGLPLFFLELCLGQYVKKGSITLWNKICPYMKGVGYCSMLVSWYVSFYYNVLIAWSVYFIYRSVLSFGSKMPWEDCDNPWNSRTTCVSISQLKQMCAQRTNETLESCRKDLFSTINVTSPASEFFVKELSQIDQSTGLEDMGYLRTELVLCTMVVYLLHYFSLFRGLETSGKVVWVTATAPYMILSILLVRGLFLPGASMGMKYYLSPKLEKLADPQVWIDAAGQVFYSIGVGFGVHLTYASFNPHNNDCHRDCLVTTAVNALTSVYSGLVVFVYLGYMAANLGIEIDKVASEGYSLVFEVYPEALTTLPFARFWSILFFIMLLTLGIDSAMAALEAVITGLEDEFKVFKRLTRAQLTGVVIVSSFLPALISCTQGGAYTLFWFDIYSAGVSLLFAALFETIGVVYCYGLDKFIVNIESMLGKKPHLFYILCWKYISPIFLMGIIFMSIYTASVPVYRGYTFPQWSVVAGWCLAFSSVSAVPILAIWTWYSMRSAPEAISVSPYKSPARKSPIKSSSAAGDGKSTHGGKSMAVVNYTGPTAPGQSTLVGPMGQTMTTTTTSSVINVPPSADHQQHQQHHHHHHHHLHHFEPTPGLDGVREEMV